MRSETAERRTAEGGAAEAGPAHAGGEPQAIDATAARICDAMLACVARWGVTKTTLEDVAREAGVGRATIYRTFQGGKGHLLRATLARESERFLAEIERAMAGADGLADVVVAAVTTSARLLAGHDALNYLLAHEPDVVLPHVAFHRMGALFDVAAAFADPHLAPYLPDPEQRARAAEWVARVVLTYVFNPVEGTDLADAEAARHLVRTFILPGLLSRAASPPAPHSQES